ncbi:MAG TPA: iron ABC transporter permease [Trueperaceae bacterium]|nr:iron ABC transporter permease [Trueperaceae bacterium]
MSAAAPVAARRVGAPRFSAALLPALLALAGLFALPLGRPGRALLTVDPSLYATAIGGPLVWAVLVAMAATAVVCLLPMRTAQRGDAVLVVGGLALAGLLAWLVGTGTPFGTGALVALAGLVLALGAGLSESGRVQSDPFVASSILFVVAFVLLFIVYPLFTVLKGAVWANGSFDLTTFVATLRHPLFFVLENPATAVSEAALALRWGAGGAVVGLATALFTRARPARAVLLTVGLAAVGFVLGVLVYGSGALVTSLAVVLIVAPLCTLLGLAFALLGQRASSGLVRRSLGVISVLPIITPPFILAFAMVFLLGRRGLVTYNLLGLNSSWIYGIPGVAIAQVLAFTPVAYLLLRGAIGSLNPALEEAAQTLGARPGVTLRTITWPLLRPALAASFLLSMIESLADFGNPVVLGGNRRFLAKEVYLSLTGRFNPREAAVYGVALLALVLLAFFVQRWWLGGSSFITVTGKPASGALARLPRALEAVLVGLLALWAVFVAALYASIVLGSFTRLWGVNYTLTTQHYRDFMNAGWPVFLYTLRVAAISAVPAMLLGLLVAFLVARQSFFGRRFIEFGSLLSFATPGTVMGVAYIFAFNTGPWLLTSTATIIVLALVFRNMPVAIRSAVAGLSQVDPSLEEASTMLRARSWTTLRRVLFPLLVNVVVTGLVYAFVRAVTAISQVIFLVSPGNQHATVLLLGWVEQGQLGRAAAMGTVLIFSMLFAILLVLALSRRLGSRMVEVTV